MVTNFGECPGFRSFDLPRDPWCFRVSLPRTLHEAQSRSSSRCADRDEIPRCGGCLEAVNVDVFWGYQRHDLLPPPSRQQNTAQPHGIRSRTLALIQTGMTRCGCEISGAGTQRRPIFRKALRHCTNHWDTELPWCGLRRRMRCFAVQFCYRTQGHHRDSDRNTPGGFLLMSRWCPAEVLLVVPRCCPVASLVCEGGSPLGHHRATRVLRCPRV